MNPRDVAYDLEVYPNVFTCTLVHIPSRMRWIYEISPWVNQSAELHKMIIHMRTCQMRMVGFNNIGYDYTILHTFMELVSAQGYATAEQLYAKSQQIFNSQGDDDRFGMTIWENNRHVEQLDLYKIHHFDNKNRRTGLKALEINMNSYMVEDLPFPPGTVLTKEQVPVLIRYNAHDVDETIKFYIHSYPMIEFRETLSAKYGRNFMNHNDTKIGKDYFIAELEKAIPGSCFDPTQRRKTPRQTPRETIPLGDIILPYIQFQHPELQRVLTYIKGTTLTTTRKPPELNNLFAIINGFQFDFGAGGIHGSIEKRVVRSNDTHIIIDADVTSYYPSVPIANRFFPEHLSEKFCDIYEDVFNQRAQFPKGTPESEMLKLALNGVYGDSNNPYSPFLDPRYTMQVTINGQLSIAMLSEQLIAHCGAEMIQANTDGITVRIRRDKKEMYDHVCKWWMDLTKLKLEFAEYDGMWIRDVNSYLARKTDGGVKRVGAYQHVRPDEAAKAKKKPELGWHQDHSALVVPKAAEAVMLRGEDLRTFVYSHTNMFDFMLRAKAPKTSKLVLVNSDGTEKQTQNTTRYVIARDGSSLVKIMPPTARKPDAIRRIGINVGWSVHECNSLANWDWEKLNREYYIEETKKLLLTNGDV